MWQLRLNFSSVWTSNLLACLNCLMWCGLSNSLLSVKLFLGRVNFVYSIDIPIDAQICKNLFRNISFTQFIGGIMILL